MKTQLSVVSSMYLSEKHLEEFVEKSVAAVAESGYDSYEIILVNDGSPDASLQKAIELKKKVPQIRIIDLSRNFGHHYAFFCGMAQSKGELIFNIDCDLEVKPSVLKEMSERMKETGSDVVYGYQENRKGSTFEKASGGIFWTVFNKLSHIEMPANVLTERIMTRRYIDALLEMGDKNLFMAGIMQWTGFKQTGIPVVKANRKSRSSYTIRKRILLLIEAITSFSSYPLRVLFYTGSLITLMSFLYGSYLLLNKLLHPDKILGGYTSIIVTVLFSTGLIIASLGVIGLYLEKIFNQVKNRPLYIIRQIYE